MGDIERGDINDFSKLDLRDGVIHYALYQQDGAMQPMVCADTLHNRRFVSWVQIHDRVAPAEENPNG